MSVFKSYPSWGDAALHLAWLPLFTELFTCTYLSFWLVGDTNVSLTDDFFHLDLRYTFLVSLVYTFASALAIVFYHIWIVLGTGNANFFFAITLVHALGQIMLLIDSIYAVLRREFFLLYPAYRQHKVVQT
jgi:phosphatidylinositol glycan class U